MVRETSVLGRSFDNEMRTLVLIDGDYLSYVLMSLDIRLDFAKFYDFLIQRFGKGARIRYYSSFDARQPGHQEFFNYIAEIGYTVVASPLQRVGRAGGYIRTALDTLLAVDAISLSEAMERVVLISGDKDFVALVKALQRRGKVTVVVGLPIVTSAVLREIPNQFILLEEFFLKSISSEEPSETKIIVPLPENSAKAYYLAKGQYFNNYVILRNLLKSVRSHITIIDSYISEEILQTASILSPSVRLRVITQHIEGGDFAVLLRKLRLDGRDIEVYRSPMFHDRFLRIDDDWWHLGYSIKSLGKAVALIQRISEVTIRVQLCKDEETVYRQSEPIR